jgi:hypothetical protein
MSKLQNLSDAQLVARINENVTSIGKSLSELRPLIEEAWRRLESGKTVYGCKTKIQFCDKVLHKTDRAVQYMLKGGNSKRSIPANHRNVSPPAPPSAPEMPSLEAIRRAAFLKLHPEYVGKSIDEVDPATYKNDRQKFFDTWRNAEPAPPPPPATSNRELKRIEFKRLHPACEGKPNAEVDDAIYKSPVPVPAPTVQNRLRSLAESLGAQCTIYPNAQGFALTFQVSTEEDAQDLLRAVARKTAVAA